MPAEIQISLFELLDKIAVIAEVNEKETDPDKHFLGLNRIQKYLDDFSENFFIQLFEAFGLIIDFISEETLSEVEKYFSKYKDKVPSHVLGIFKEVYEIVEDMDDDVYFDSPQAVQTIDYAYFIFLPKLFDTIRADENILNAKISNYPKVKVRMDGILAKIQKIHKQLFLSEY